MKKLALPIALLAGLACPVLAAEPEAEAVEFYNLRLQHYFVTATAQEARQVDEGAAGTDWVRTGRSFRVWADPANAPASSAAVCRFYSPGANSHFYTGDPSECESLKQLEAAERDRARATGAAVRGWQYEGVAFRIEPPAGGACPAGTTAILRVYNDGFANGEGANHRFVDDSQLRALMEDRSWITEGVAFCARNKPTGTQANAPATSTSFDAVAAKWAGVGRWETRATRIEANAPVALEISASGAVTGSGAGCALSGQLQAGDGFRSLFSGTLSAAACNDAAFNGAYPRFSLELYGTGTLMLEARAGDGANEVSIEATLSPGTASPSAPVTPGPAGIAGNFSGSFTADIEVRDRNSNITTATSASSATQLSVTPSGAVSGGGFGCTFTGTIAPSSTAGLFSGTLTAAGCTNAALNGAYAATAHADNNALSVEMEKQTEAGNVRTRARIRGTAART